VSEHDVMASLVYKIVLLLGGGGAVLIAVIAAIWATVSAVITSRMIEDRKAELARELETTKAELGHDLERYKSYLSQETETHKLKLKKSEIPFNKLIDSAGEFIQLHQSIQPTFSYPDMIKDEAIEEVAGRFDRIEKDLKAYMAKNGAVIPRYSRNHLAECIELTSAYKFGMSEGGYEAATAKKAEELLESLAKVEQDLIEAVGGTA
jgi:hypothetical protein